MVLRGEDLGVIGVERELAPVALLLAEPEEALHGGATVGALHPFTLRPPLELGGFGRLGQRLARAEQRLDVYAVVDGFGFLGVSHRVLLESLFGEVEKRPTPSPVWRTHTLRRWNM